MHARELVDLAAVVAVHAPSLIRAARDIPEESVEAYWVASKCRLDRWGRMLKRLTTALVDEEKPLTTAERRLLRGVLEEILASEVLTRIWTAAMCAYDQTRQTDVMEPVARSVLIGHMEARHRVLTFMARFPRIDGEPAMKLESAAAGMAPEPWDLTVSTRNGCEMLSTGALLKKVFLELQEPCADDLRRRRTLAASFQFNLARGIAALALRAAEREGMKAIALSGGVAYNHAIRETIRREVLERGFTCIINADYPLGDGCVSFGQCVYAGMVLGKRRD